MPSAALWLEPTEITTFLALRMVTGGKFKTPLCNSKDLHQAVSCMQQDWPPGVWQQAQQLTAVLSMYHIQALWAHAITSSWQAVKPAVSILFVRGDPKLLQLPAIAIVGARRASASACRWAQKLAGYWTRQNQIIISGGALGVDAAAHCGALAAGGQTVVVMGSAIDKAYPRVHCALFQQILAQGGALVSEHPPLTASQPWHFAIRNRLIAALATRLVVVEAGLQSGTLGCAAYAKALKRPVWVAPPSVGGERAGIKQLLQQQAATLYPF